MVPLVETFAVGLAEEGVENPRSLLCTTVSSLAVPSSSFYLNTIPTPNLTRSVRSVRSNILCLVEIVLGFINHWLTKNWELAEILFENNNILYYYFKLRNSIIKHLLLLRLYTFKYLSFILFYSVSKSIFFSLPTWQWHRIIRPLVPRCFRRASQICVTLDHVPCIIRLCVDGFRVVAERRRSAGGRFIIAGEGRWARGEQLPLDTCVHGQAQRGK